MEIPAKSRTEQQKKELQVCNNKLNYIGKEIVDDVLRKCPHLEKKTEC